MSPSPAGPGLPLLDETVPAAGGVPRLVWRSVDSARWLTLLVLGGTVAAVVLAFTGMPDFSMMGPLYSVGLVTPTCGLTRSIVSIVHGELALAWRLNPGGFLLVGLAAVIAGRWAIARATGRWLGMALGDRRPAVAVAVVALISLWANQQANADFVMNTAL